MEGISLLLLLFSILGGYLLGLTSGLLSGIHHNNFALALVALAPFLAEKGLEYDLKSRPVRHFVEECLEEAPDYFIPNIQMNEKLMQFCSKFHAAELSENEIKQKILIECANAGWNVSSKVVRISKLPNLIQKTLKDIGIEDKQSLRCCIGVKFVDAEENSQKTLSSMTAKIKTNESASLTDAQIVEKAFFE